MKTGFSLLMALLGLLLLGSLIAYAIDLNIAVLYFASILIVLPFFIFEFRLRYKLLSISVSFLILFKIMGYAVQYLSYDRIFSLFVMYLSIFLAVVYTIYHLKINIAYSLRNMRGLQYFPALLILGFFLGTAGFLVLPKASLSGHSTGAVVIAALAFLFFSFVEELLFRILIQDVVHSSTNDVTAIIFTSVFYALSVTPQVNIFAYAFLFISGAAIAFVYQKTRNLYLSALFNYCIFITLLFILPSIYT